MTVSPGWTSATETLSFRRPRWTQANSLVFVSRLDSAIVDRRAVRSRMYSPAAINATESAAAGRLPRTTRIVTAVASSASADSRRSSAIVFKARAAIGAAPIRSSPEVRMAGAPTTPSASAAMPLISGTRLGEAAARDSTLPRRRCGTDPGAPRSSQARSLAVDVWRGSYSSMSEAHAAFVRAA